MTNCLNCNNFFIKVRIDQKYCKRICSLQHRYKTHKKSQYSIDWREKSLQKKLDKIPEERVKNLFNKSKKQIIEDGYSAEINKKLTKIIGFDRWRRSPKGKDTLKNYFKRDDVKKKLKDYNQREDIKKRRNKSRRVYNSTEEGQKRTKIKNLKAKAKPDFREKTNRYVRKRTREDPKFKLRTRLSSYINGILKKQKATKSKKFHDLLGCSLENLKKHLESKFKKGMTWENHGLHGWHIDHIKPLSKFNLIEPEEQKKAFHYLNLQPLWAIDNIRKGNKY